MNFFSNFSLISSLKKNLANKYNNVAPVVKANRTISVPIHLPKIKPPIKATGLPKPKRSTQQTVNTKKIKAIKNELLSLKLLTNPYYFL